MAEATVRVAVGIGSNLGDREAHVDAAHKALAELGSMYAFVGPVETDPVGGPEQGKYLNAVAVFDTTLSARELFDRLMTIERSRGRERRERWGPRTLDLDLLLYGEETIDEPGLTVPHPRMEERLFVMAPLADAWPDAVMPDGRSVKAIARALNAKALGLDSPGAYLTVFLVTGMAAVILWWIIDALIR